MKIIYFLLFLVPLNLIGQESASNKFIYLGNDNLSNFEVSISNITKSNRIVNLKAGEELTGFNSEHPTFVIAKDYEFILSPKATRQEKIICYSINHLVYPDSGATYQSLKQINTSSETVLKDLRKRSIYGPKSQIVLWNKLNNLSLDTNKSHIYSYSNKIKFESKKTQTINVLALIDTIIIDTLIKNKLVGEGEYLLKTNKVVLANQKGAIGYQINNTEKALYSTLKPIYTRDSLVLEFPFDFYAKRMYTGTTLKAFDNHGELITTLFDKKTQEKGRNIAKYKVNYFGLPDDKITLKLTTKKGIVLKEKLVSSLQLNNSNNLIKGKSSYLKIEHKYSSKKSENRISCFIEDEQGKVIATVFKNRNIHTGINKVKYTLTHTLGPGEIAILYVRTASGRVIERKEFSIH